MQVCFLAMLLLVAITVSNLGIVLSLVGATGSTAVSYILPGFFFYYTFTAEEAPAWKRRLALAQGILGLAIVPIFLTFILM